jgi:hypothetical protein
MHPRLADDLARLPELLGVVQENAVPLLAALDNRAAARAPDACAASACWRRYA